MLCLVFLVRCCGVLIKISRYQLIKDKQLVFTSSLGRVPSLLDVAKRMIVLSTS